MTEEAELGRCGHKLRDARRPRAWKRQVVLPRTSGGSVSDFYSEELQEKKFLWFKPPDLEPFVPALGNESAWCKTEHRSDALSVSSSDLCSGAGTSELGR